MADSSIDPASHIGAVHLTVRDLDREVAFYTDVLGLRAERQEGGATLSADGSTPLLVLEHNPDAAIRSPRTTGLYHFALLVPSRRALARMLAYLAESRYPLQGASDHLVSEALYLADPEENGIEIYRDRPRTEWPLLNGQIQMASDPLDFAGIMGERQGDDQPWQGIDPGTVMGHIHLQVADIAAAEQFYVGVLGFDLITHFGRSASFVSAGGYHHHIGMNTWASLGASPPPPGSTGLSRYVIALPSADALSAVSARLRESGTAFTEDGDRVIVTDPFGIKVSLRAVPARVEAVGG
jgi:catechol 2,3-dioxygenase